MTTSHHRFASPADAVSPSLKGETRELASSEQHLRADSLSTTHQKRPTISFTRSIRSDIPVTFFVGLIGLMMNYAILYLKQSVGVLSRVDSLVISTILLSLTLLIASVIVVFRRLNTRYRVSDVGVESVIGIVSNRQIQARFTYDQIRGTEIRQSFFQRMVGTGDLIILGAMNPDLAVTFLGIASPAHFERLIQTRYSASTHQHQTRRASPNIAPQPR